MSLISLYTSFFDKNGIDYDLIYIDKYNEIEHTTAKNVYRYSIEINREWNILKKLSVYWGFKKFAKRIFDKNQYDHVIVWKTETAIMFADLLLQKFRKKYFLNIRDYCFENNPIVFQITKALVIGAEFTTISSDGFKVFLPEYQYLTIHSLNMQLLKECKPKKRIKRRDEIINICFIGYVRFFEVDKRIIDAFANDFRFNMNRAYGSYITAEVL